jgi:hypothetical protein
MNRHILARSLLVYTTNQLRDILTGDFTLIFDDGKIETNAQETIYSSYAWEIHKRYPTTPMLISHHVKHVLKGKRLNRGTHLELLGNCMWAAHDSHPEKAYRGVEIRDEMSILVYDITAGSYSDLITHVEEYVTSIDIVDFVEIIDHPDVTEILNNPDPTQEYIVKAYDSLKTLLSGNKLDNNPIVKASKSNLVNTNQLLQCLGPRGYLTDIDSHRFNTPIVRSFTQGFKDFYSSLIESRSAAKSLFQNKSMLEEAEYFSRKIQLLCMGVENLHEGDCGSTEYLLWKVTPPVIENGRTVYEGDLKHMEGKYFLDEVNNKLSVISKKDTHLFGQTLKLRSPIAGCKHSDPHGLCSVCFGTLSDSVPAKTNIGHFCAVTMTEKSTQSVLSTKHLDTSALIAVISLALAYQSVLAIGADGNSYLFNSKLKGKELKLVIEQAEFTGITDISIVDNVSKLSTARVSSISSIGVITEFSAIEIPVFVDKRFASLTYEMLQYIRDNGYTVDENSNAVIDMVKWDFSKPILTLPMKQMNMGDHSASIASLLQQSDTSDSPEARLGDLFSLVTSKLDVNLAVLELIIYAGMVVNNEDEDYNFPKPWTDKEMGGYVKLVTNRSFSVAMAYEEQRARIADPSSYFKAKRPSHILDVFLMPEEAIRDV